MTKADIVDQISPESEATKKEILKIIDIFLDKIKENVNNGQQVNIRGFGSFYMATKKARKIKSPIANRTLEVPLKTILAFKGSRETEKVTGA